MTDEIKRLPYNPQGNLDGAWVPEELVTVRPSTGTGFNFLVPKYAPYFRNGLKIYNPETNAYLEEGVDFLCTHPFRAMAALTGLELYGSIMLLDTAFSGQLQLNYFSLGGEFTLDQQQILNVLANNLYDPRVTFWEKVADVPSVFPPINHQHNVETDTMTWDDVVAAIESLKEPLEEGFNKAMTALLQHENRRDNPHGVTKAQVGLGNVQNFTTATESDLETIGENLYMTLAMTRKMIANLSGDSAAAHISNYNNPHKVTKAQVGLGNVENYGTADSNTTITGTATNLYTTPAGVRAAIKAITDGLSTRIDNVNATLTAHTGDKNNPHGVTKAQVGLGNVLNYGVASNVEAAAGVANDKYMTPATTAAAIAGLITPTVTDHIGNTNNPHGVTKAQVGLGSVQNFGVATTQEAIDGQVNNKYMTPILVRYAIEQLAGQGFSSHIANTENPHRVTKSQVGLGSVENYPVASDEEAQTGEATNRYMTPAATKAAITALAGDGFAAHVVNKSNPHEVTKVQVGLSNVQNFNVATDTEAVDNTNQSAYMTPYSTYKSIVAFAALANHTHTAEQVGALPINGGKLTGPIDLSATSITGAGIGIDGVNGSINTNTLTVNQLLEAYGGIESSDTIKILNDDETPANFLADGDLEGIKWVNINSQEPGENQDGEKMQKIGKLSDYLKNDYLTSLQTNTAFRDVFQALLKEFLANFNAVIKATDFETL